MTVDLISMFEMRQRELATSAERRTWREAWAAGATVKRLERALSRARTTLQLHPAR